MTAQAQTKPGRGTIAVARQKLKNLYPATMIDLIDQHRSELAELCRQYHVRRLEVLGSAAAGLRR